MATSIQFKAYCTKYDISSYHLNRKKHVTSYKKKTKSMIPSDYFHCYGYVGCSTVAAHCTIHKGFFFLLASFNELIQQVLCTGNGGDNIDRNSTVRKAKLLNPRPFLLPSLRKACAKWCNSKQLMFYLRNENLLK